MNDSHRHGSSSFSDTRINKAAGLYDPHGAFIGQDERGRICRSAQQSALLLCGGARSGKGNLGIPWLVDGAIRDANGPHHMINMDWKSEDSPVAGLQVIHGRHHVTFNLRKRRGMPAHHISPVSHLVASSPALVPDAHMHSMSWIPFTDPRAAYFEGVAQLLNTSAIVTMVRLNGSVTLPEIADKMACLGSLDDEWLDLEFEMGRQPEAEIRGVVEDLKRMRKSDGDAGGFASIKNEIARSYACMMDTQMREALSPPFDFCFSQLTQDDCPPTMVSIMEDFEFAETSAPVIKALYTCALVYKRRAINARPQFWCLNEIGNIGAWPLAESLATISAGYGIRTAYIVQSTRQLENLKKGASEVIPNSCGTAIYMGTRSTQQAQLINRQLGRMTLSYDDIPTQERARAEKAQALADVVMGGGDPFQTAIRMKYQEERIAHQRHMPRDLRTVAEIINERNDRAYVFMPGVLERPFYAHIPKYWQRRDLAGMYLGNPFHARPGTVEIATWRGQRHVQIITEEAPRQYRDWPQFRDDGLWSYVKGYRP